MMRSMGMIIGACCVATVLSEAIGLGLLWSRGQLTASTVRDIRAVLSGQDLAAAAVDEEMQRVDLSRDDVVRERSMRVLELNSLQNELTVLKGMVDSRKTSLLAEQKAFLKQKEDFEKTLAAIDAQRTSAAAEQARAVLLAMPPADAVTTLMRLNLEENVVLLKEMPEKKIAALLKSFAEGNDGPKVTRGQEVFEALSRGEPARGQIREAARKLRTPDSAADTPNTAKPAAAPGAVPPPANP
jgi:hypothetical protein